MSSSPSDLDEPALWGWNQLPEGAWNWLGPDDDLRRRRLAFSRREPGHIVSFLLVALLIVLVLGSVVQTAISFLEGNGGTPTYEGTGPLVQGLGINLVFFTVPPLVWAWNLHGGSEGLRVRLGLRTDRLGPDLLVGVAVALVTVVATIGLLLMLQALGVSTENPGVEDISRNIPWWGVPLLALSAGIGEEVFFRGLLQPRVGIVPSAVFFGFVHLSYGTPLQIVVPLLLGLVYSVVFVRTRSIVPAIVAHTLFNGLMLALSKLYGV